MSIPSEVQRLETAKEALASAITGKGVTVPDGTKLDGYAALVEQIQAGGGSTSYDPSEFIIKNGEQLTQEEVNSETENVTERFVILYESGMEMQPIFVYILFHGTLQTIVVWSQSSFTSSGEGTEMICDLGAGYENGTVKLYHDGTMASFGDHACEYPMPFSWLCNPI